MYLDMAVYLDMKRLVQLILVSYSCLGFVLYCTGGLDVAVYFYMKRLV